MSKINITDVVNEGKFHTLISIGDIQRAIIKNVPFETPIFNIVRKGITVSNDKESF